ncbi:MAG TPA: ABC-F family ATP-binding cassette domain-containing protein, partial [Firmicutes bacterium]|nr:ABC-F family ATP-binding cassette domain-containing protein [Bacillota bacterium]
IGPNGAGKTTLLKLITGEEKPDSGVIKIGPSVKAAYFAQEQEKLNPEHTLLEEIISVTELSIPEARNYLGRYLFTGEQVFKQIKHLSGGEKCRLALARLELIESNCLLLDEPTSHLDLTSLEELEQTLRDYPGTLVLVSHDRYFLSSLVNRVFELAGGRLRTYSGSYQEYLERLRQEKTGQQVTPCQSARPREKGGAPPEQLRQQRRARQIKEEQQELEKSITRVEQEISSLEMQLADPNLYSDYAKVKQLHAQLRMEQGKAADLLKSWEQISVELEVLRSALDSHEQ